MIRNLLVVVFSLMLPTLAAGQTPVDWDMHVGVLDPGEKVHVRTLEGKTIHGRFVGVDRDSITVRRKGRETRVPAGTVRIVARPDRVWNGAAIGFMSGFAAVVVWEAVRDTGLSCEYGRRELFVCGTAAGVYGFGIGLAVDGIIRGDRPVFRRTGGSEIRVAPSVTSREKALKVHVSF